MRLLSFIFKEKSKKRSSSSDYYQESLNKMGREQFKKLLDKGLHVPIALQ